jgi:F0F1-type ATP synthase membrane subunit c/vacuolar-type H+-ATPase subunit K
MRKAIAFALTGAVLYGGIAQGITAGTVTSAAAGTVAAQNSTSSASGGSTGWD